MLTWVSDEQQVHVNSVFKTQKELKKGRKKEEALNEQGRIQSYAESCEWCSKIIWFTIEISCCCYS